MIRTDDDEAKIEQYQSQALDIALELSATIEGAKFKSEKRSSGKRFHWEHNRQLIQLMNGRKIELKFDDPAGRITVDGILPRYLDGQPVYTAEKVNPAITCSMNRNPADIARDIENRLIPGFYAAYSKAEDMIAADLENVKWVRETATIMIAAGLSPNVRSSWEAPDQIKKASARLTYPHPDIQQVEISGTYRRVSYNISGSRYQEPAAAIQEMNEIAQVLSRKEATP